MITIERFSETFTIVIQENTKYNQNQLINIE